MKGLEGIVSKFGDARILVVGDVMLDRYVFGEATRLSPEAPVPIVKVSEEKDVLGGAANVAANIAALGGKAYLCGVIGKDAYGMSIEDIAERMGIVSLLFKAAGVQTTVKTRVVADRQQVVRYDLEERTKHDALFYGRLPKSVMSAIEAADVIVLSDYSKGVLDTNLSSHIITMASEYSKPLLVDPKPVNMGYFRGAECVAPNLKEALEIVNKPVFKIEKGSAKYLRDVALKICTDYKAKQAAITCGDHGIYAFDLSENTGKLLPAKAREVYDVSGAGDTALAVIALARAVGADLYQACAIANAASGVVVSKVGTATLSLAELRSNLRK